MKVFLLLLYSLFFIRAVLIAQDDELPAPSEKPPSQNQNRALPVAKRDDSPFLMRYARANQMNFIIEPDIDFGYSARLLSVGLAPSIGHKVWKGLYAGAGLVYLYSGSGNVLLADINGQPYFVNAHNYTYGGGVFIQYNIWKGLYVRVRFDLLHRQIEDFNDATVLPNPKTGAFEINMPVRKLNIPDMPVGIGYNILVAKKLFLPIKLSYNVLYPFLNKTNTVYPDGWIVKMCFINIF